MSQILHIFKKDARHLGLEIFASVFITGLFVLLYPQQWPHGGYSSPVLAIVSSLMTALVPVGWWVMMTRLIQGESLVGDRLFWITRPYQWQKLLAAKVLFIAVFLYLPLLTAQSLMLRAAGFHPLPYLPGLLCNLLLLTALFLLPIAVLGSVTTNFSRAVLAILALIICIATVITITSLSTQRWSPDTSATSFVWLLLCVLGVAILVVQYSTRNLRLSSWLLGAIAVIVGLCMFAWPNSAIIRSTFPSLAANASPPLQLRFDINSPRKVTANIGRDADELWINIPLTVSGIAPGSAVRQEGVRVSITAPNGLQWSSSHWSVDGQYLTSTDTDTVVIAPVSREFLQKVKDLPVRVQFSWASSRLRAGVTHQVAAQNDTFALPSGGVCSLQNYVLSSSVFCKFAVREPHLSFFTAAWSSLPCSQSSLRQNTLLRLSGWTGSLEDVPVSPSLSSVWTTALNFRDQNPSMSSSAGHQFLCPGTPISFTDYTLVDRSRFDVIIPEIQLPYEVTNKRIPLGAVDPQ